MIMPDDNDGIWITCWQCCGIGIMPGCFEDCCSGVDCNPEDAELCCCPNICGVCWGTGGWYRPDFEKESS